MLYIILKTMDLECDIAVGGHGAGNGGPIFGQLGGALQPGPRAGRLLLTVLCCYLSVD